MNGVPRSERLHIALFGRRNVGKSSLINALTGQEVAVVSAVAGTTTDPVYKSMELLPLGPVVFIDTPGLDDDSILGRLRMEKTKAVLRQTDLALLVITPENPWGPLEEELTAVLAKENIPFIILLNKSDRLAGRDALTKNPALPKTPLVEVSALTGEGITDVVAALVKLGKEETEQRSLVDGLVKAGDVVILVTHLDQAAPKGRLILPQQQVLRAVLDRAAIALVTRETELAQTLNKLTSPPSLVITDSQVFGQVNTALPADVPLTSFSILYARYKGNLNRFYQAVQTIKDLDDGDRVLIAEGCTHHRKEDDIGTVQIPKLLKKRTGKQLSFDHVSGGFFAADLTGYKMVIHCGACMLNRREMAYRQDLAGEKGVPMVNYGILLAYLHGILERALKPFAGELGELAGQRRFRDEFLR
ncbi:MAG TPA: [FeFe] hydrogenase H-cluster maturation GTPase HydF [Firmicutes bacterium]|uniref:[FeFe] hydrogenase H-cluster maturation GTPase HydF n=1 Tax=Capillibacterium thermochitinicola TaxID=2699427 RepID=A0A8J6I0H9_9FIRM|nr:[FeFe] hydrogenase H-cluster maturation GTPase HydF [Capillibacterium thermochitinicola]MBA2132728.1 [FeFe] hydrogenase H-cluster maturation GTPase HydF [Capillibacterium thermochitinicola]HHW11756.1 [FeFe] hydrogenase H-cluster maturation GTPase HydF [Bacillota bacterium]